MRSVLIGGLLATSSIAGHPAQAGSERPALPPEARDLSAPIPVVVKLEQDELRVRQMEITGTDAYGRRGGLILIAIESGANKRAKAELQPALGDLKGFDAQATLTAGIAAGISDKPWLTLAPTGAGSGHYLAEADCSYGIGLAFESLSAACAVRVSDRRQPASPKRILDRIVESEVALYSDNEKIPFHDCYDKQRRAVCLSYWSANGSARLKQQLAFALTQTGKMVGEVIASDGTAFVARAGQSANLLHVSMTRSGYVVRGADHVGRYGSRPTFSTGFKAAKVAPGGDGVTIVQQDGSLYQRSAVSVP